MKSLTIKIIYDDADCWLISICNLPLSVWSVNFPATDTHENWTGQQIQVDKHMYYRHRHKEKHKHKHKYRQKYSIKVRKNES